VAWRKHERHHVRPFLPAFGADEAAQPGPGDRRRVGPYPRPRERSRAMEKDLVRLDDDPAPPVRLTADPVEPQIVASSGFDGEQRAFRRLTGATVPIEVQQECLGVVTAMRTKRR